MSTLLQGSGYSPDHYVTIRFLFHSLFHSVFLQYVLLLSAVHLCASLVLSGYLYKCSWETVLKCPLNTVCVLIQRVKFTFLSTKGWLVGVGEKSIQQSVVVVCNIVLDNIILDASQVPVLKYFRIFLLLNGQIRT